MSKNCIRDQVCLVSPNDFSREGVSHFLRSDGFELVFTCATVEDISSIESPENYLIIIDLQEPAAQADAVEELISMSSDMKVAVLAEQFDLETMVKCFQVGAQAYVVKSMQSKPLVTALRLASLGEKVLPSDLVDILNCNAMNLPLAQDVEEDIEMANLSPREMDVLCCLMAGFPNKVIARELSVCEATVKVHVKAILRKLKVNNRTQAAIWASSHQIRETLQPA